MGTYEQHGDDVGTALRCNKIVEGVDDTVVQVENGWGVVKWTRVVTINESRSTHKNCEI